MTQINPMTPESPSRPTISRLRLLLVGLPLVFFLALAVLFYIRLGAGDASRLPSPLIGKNSPEFSLPALEGANVPGLSSADLKKSGVTLVNIFASWCVPCREEHRVLNRLIARRDLLDKGVRLVGINYKDEPQNALKFLKEGQNPYSQIGVDANGRAAIDWGVYGVPETFVVRADGVIAYKFIGPLTDKSIEETLLPQIEKALAQK
jgi:cytochrome c biogenesis protein CcmG/thiol:disulfide interchange protein DsbE